MTKKMHGLPIFKKAIRIATFVIIATALPSWASQDQVTPPSFNADNTVNLPTGYRQWVHVGTRINTQGNNIIDSKPIAQPEILNAYVEPSAFEHFKKTGQWADGSQIVKEFSKVKTGEDCNPANFTCKTKIGTAIFQANYTGLGMMIKDSRRFSKENGYWGYFHFGHHEQPYNATSELRPTQQCAACHNAGAADQDYVFSSAHAGLRALLQNP
ncbi:MAG: cytochrome P460 family protein [Pseudomonadales bacterium]|jgi:hypothetical protein